MEKINSCQEEHVLLDLPPEPMLGKFVEFIVFFLEGGDGVHIALDFSGVGIVRAGTLGKMLTLRNLLEERRRSLLLVNVRPETLGIFETTHLDRVFTINDGNNHQAL